MGSTVNPYTSRNKALRPAALRVLCALGALDVTDEVAAISTGVAVQRFLRSIGTECERREAHLRNLLGDDAHVCAMLDATTATLFERIGRLEQRLCAFEAMAPGSRADCVNDVYGDLAILLAVSFELFDIQERRAGTLIMATVDAETVERAERAMLLDAGWSETRDAVYRTLPYLNPAERVRFVESIMAVFEQFDLSLAISLAKIVLSEAAFASFALELVSRELRKPSRN